MRSSARPPVQAQFVNASEQVLQRAHTHEQRRLDQPVAHDPDRRTGEPVRRRAARSRRGTGRRGEIVAKASIRLRWCWPKRTSTAPTSAVSARRRSESRAAPPRRAERAVEHGPVDPRQPEQPELARTRRQQQADRGRARPRRRRRSRSGTAPPPPSQQAAPPRTRRPRRRARRRLPGQQRSPIWARLSAPVRPYEQRDPAEQQDRADRVRDRERQRPLERRRASTS